MAGMAEVQTGDILAGKYRVERILGEGGMGIVVAATHLALDERVALKFMRAEAIDRDDGAQRFLREARAAVKLKSEHVARVLDVGTLQTGAPFIVMEYLEGSDLAHVLAARGPLPVEEAIDYVLQACDAVAEAHSRGIIHRDLKPANLFVTHGRDGAPLIKVLDFGISKFNVLGDRPDSVTSSLALLGSPVYMSPEQMKSSRDVEATTDIWSLGIILYEAISGRVPFNEQTMGALMAKVLTSPPPPLRTLQASPPALAAVVEKCLEKEPSHRYASIAELAIALAPFAPLSERRVSSIVSMGRVSHAPSSAVSSLSSTLPLAESDAHPSVLGVAATQALASESAPVDSKRRGVVYAAVAVLAIVVTGAALVGMRIGGEKKAPDQDIAIMGSPGVPKAAPPASQPEVIATGIPMAIAPSLPVSGTSYSVSLPSATSPALPVTSAHAPPRSANVPKPVSASGRNDHPSPSAKPTLPPEDPFGTSRQ